MEQPTSYYSLEELLVQRANCASFGMSTDGIEVEIALVVEQESMAARLRHPSAPRDVISEARDVLDAAARPFDQDA